MTDKNRYVLGLDIGTNSLDWALLRADQRSRPIGIEKMGVRVFEAGVEGDIQSGRHESRAAARRQARLARRQTARRRRRRQKIMHLLQESALLPTHRDMASAFLAIDTKVLEKHRVSAQVPSLAHVAPYYLRARALDHRLELHELGRAFYHLGQRRGFLSNRKIPSTDDEGVVKSGIRSLRQEMEQAGSRTLGEFFSTLDPEEERIRTRYTHRKMFEDEFALIWDCQKDHWPAVLTDELRHRLHKAMFFQRKLKSATHLIGKCSLEHNAKRCPWHRPEAQQFRILQTVNNLKILDVVTGERDLEYDERDAVLAALAVKDSMTFAAIRRLLNLPARKTKFNLEEGGEKAVRGNSTNARLRAVFQDRWDTMDAGEREDALHDQLCFVKRDALRRRGAKHWGLDGAALDAWTDMTLEQDYCQLSLTAIGRLLPRMEEGFTYATAVQDVYGKSVFRTEEVRKLPPVTDKIDIRNPIVKRTLNQTRKLVNAVIREYGRPDLIRIEVARDVKVGKAEKQKRTKEMRASQKAREKAAADLLEKTGITAPSRDDITRVLLAEECGWLCPYTGHAFGWNDLFGAHPQLDIEHIIPFSVSLDNSFANKTLCFADENRRTKGKKSPFQAYGSNADRYAQILDRVSRFNSPYARSKLKRFQAEDLSMYEDFNSRQLNDTRYASIQAAQYVGLLFGGTVDSAGKRKVQTVAGGITAHMRRALGVNSLLGSGEKTRSDHRHHVVDALVVALTGPRTVESLSRVASQSAPGTRIDLARSIVPWDSFLSDVASHLAHVHPVHQVGRKVRGALHQERYYSPRSNGNVHIRVPLKDMKAAGVNRIVDEAVRKRVHSKLVQLSTKDPSSAFKDEVNLPHMPGPKGPLIRKVRIRKHQSTVRIASGVRERSAIGGSNHHMEVLALLNEDGEEVAWKERLVTLLDAYQRRRSGVAIIDRTAGPCERFKFSVHRGDVFELDDGDSSRALYVVTAITSGEIRLLGINDARKVADIMKAGDAVRRSARSIRNLHPSKYHMTALGEFRHAND